MQSKYADALKRDPEERVRVNNLIIIQPSLYYSRYLYGSRYLTQESSWRKQGTDEVVKRLGAEVRLRDVPPVKAACQT